MSKYLVSVQETYRVDSEEEAEILIAEAKSDTRFFLKKYNCEHKENKKTEAEWEHVVLNKVFCDEKDPEGTVSISYEVE